MKRRIMLSPLASSMFWLLVAMLLQLSVSSAAASVNPIPVKFKKFFIAVGPTDNNPHSRLALKDSDVVLGVVEDLITAYAKEHFDENDKIDFMYAMLALVTIPSHPEEVAGTTVLDFSGGVAYFGGNSRVVPSAPEMQLLVDLALNDEDLKKALAAEFQFITRAKYIRRGEDFADNGNPTSSNGNETGSPDSLNSAPLLSGRLWEEDGNDEDATDQLIIIVVSACAASLIFCTLLALFVVVRQRKHKAYWREDAAHNNNNINNSKTTVITPAMEDAALEESDSTGDRRRNHFLRGSISKQKSLHLRDSLREIKDHDAQSDAGSSLLGRMLNNAASAAAAVLPSPPPSEDGLDLEKLADNGVEQNDSQGTSSCSHSSSDDGSTHSDHNKDEQDDVFEGNAVIKPKLVPITNLDRFNVDDENDLNLQVHEPLPPSRVVSSRSREVSITSSMTTEKMGCRPKPSQESFLAKYIHPITGSILPIGTFIGAGAANDNYINKHVNNLDWSPRTAATAGDPEVGWDDVSSDRGEKTDDDFELDKAWDPDDTSVNSSENGKDIFSPMSASSSDDDEVQLLKSTEKLHYNLHKLRAPAQPLDQVNTSLDTAVV